LPGEFIFALWKIITMETIYIIIVGVLFALAISDLIVGVSNDAVNFLNSAFGSKVAPRYIIMIIASVGIIVGTTFSSGMMEVARKGIFHPDQFVFSEIMIIFLAVMLTDIILLDLFNTLSLPTSTTVSIVFELLGAAVAISVIKMSATDGGMLSDYINSDKALAIISGILLSVVIAFILGAIAQFITRLLFSFNYSKTQRYFGALWGGLAITAITYFILIKGAKGSSLITDESLTWIKTHTFQILLYSFISWTVILQLLMEFVRLNIFKFIILIGTFALALAFASNDLVNFIGVPLAGFKSFLAYNSSGASPDAFTMESLIQPVKSNTYMLVIAGLIMVITLWFSRKARSVTRTEINLSRQDVGSERFGSTFISRVLVRRAVNFNKSLVKVLPRSIMVKMEKRFRFDENNGVGNNNGASFDLVRASVNLTIASIIISFATSLKLPLSTTYVTFMVAMGTSLSDRAWGRESAVYRITGVLTVITGWFFTAIVAFTAAFIVASIINFGGMIAVAILIVLAVLLIIRTHQLHRKREEEELELEKEMEGEELPTAESVISNSSEKVKEILVQVITLYNQIIKGLSKEDRKLLRNTNKEVANTNKKIKQLRDNTFDTIIRLQQEEVETGHYYVQVIDYLREIINCLKSISNAAWNHIDNNHKGLVSNQTKELDYIQREASLIFMEISQMIEDQNFADLNSTLSKQHKLIENINEFRKKQIKRIKKNRVKTKNSLLYFTLLNESKNLLLFTINLSKYHKDFVSYLDKGENVTD